MSSEPQNTDLPARPARARLRTLLAVAAILVAAAVIAWIAATRMREQRERERSATLARNLAALRAAIAAYKHKNGSGPAALNALVRDGQLQRIPADPVTGSSATWVLEYEQEVRADDFQSTAPAAARPAAIVEVRSGARGRDPHGKQWVDY
jgi:general secretion pathway protein G